MKKQTWLQGELERILPPNVEPERACSGIMGVGIAGAVTSAIWFLIRYSAAYRALYIYNSVLKKNVLLAGAEMRPFADFAVCAVSLLGLFTFVIAAWTALLYGSFSQGSRSLYLMRRLPEGKRILAGYVLRAPGLCLLLAAVVCVGLLAGYYLVWQFVTPGSCLPG